MDNREITSLEEFAGFLVYILFAPILLPIQCLFKFLFRGY